jgi:hypothetical protein
MKLPITMLFVMICLTMNVLSQASPSHQTIPNCDSTCPSAKRLGEDNHIFIYRQFPSPTVYEVNPDTNTITETSIASYFTGLSSWGDFAALGDNRILFAEDLISSVGFKLVDMQAQQVFTPSLNLSGTLSPCGRISGIGYTAPGYIFRYDANRVLLCTRDTNNRDAYFNLVRVENNNLVFEQRFRVGRYGEAAAHPTSWFTLLSGLDGMVYVVEGDFTIPIDHNVFTVRSYNPSTQVWSSKIVDIPISRPELITGYRFREVELVGVDPLGNMYFLEHIRGSSTEIIASRLIKFDTNSQKLWELTEADFGGNVNKIILRGVDQITPIFVDNSFVNMDLSSREILSRSH